MEKEIKLILYAENELRLIQAKVKIFRWLKKSFKDLNLQGFFFDTMFLTDQDRHYFTQEVKEK